MRNFGSDVIKADIKKLTSNIPWLIFIDLHSSPTQHYVRNLENITWDSTTYEAANFNISAIPSTSSGELPSISLNIFTSFDLVKDIEDNDGYLGTLLTIYYVYYDGNFTDPTITREAWPLKFNFKIVNTVIDNTHINFELSVPNYLRVGIPARLYKKDACDFEYKGPYCWMRGYSYSDNSLDYCDHTLDDCKRHFNYRKSHGENIFKIPFGGEPNIGKGTYIYR